MLSAFFSASETALFSLSSLTLRSYQHEKDNRKKLIAHLLQRPRDLMVTILMLNIFANILIQNVVSSLFSSYSSWLIKVGIPLVLVLFIGEVIPKSIAFVHNTRVAYLASPLISFAFRILKPIRVILTAVTSFISRFLFFFLKREKPLSINELKHLLLTSHETKVLNKDETDLLSGYLELYEAPVKEKMRPKDEIQFYNIEDPIDYLISLFADKKISRVPICSDGLDHLLGIISLERFYRLKDKIRTPKELKKYLRKPFYIPETMNCLQLFFEMRQKKESTAIVVDEYGALQGLVSDEDLIEEVIGEIKDLKDQKPMYTRSGEDVIIASGKMELDLFEKIFGVPLVSKTKAVTLGGWLIEQLGDIPLPGAKYVTDDFLFYILAAAPNRIQRIYVRKLKPLRRHGK